MDYTCRYCNKGYNSSRAIATHTKYCNRTFDQLGLGARRLYLLKEANYSCTQCGFNKTREDNKTILEIDHIDGNHANNIKENLRVLCPNCHALTSNFRNWGRNGEKSSKRFRKGNSGFEETKRLKNLEKENFNKNFIETVYNLHRNKEIDFSKFGWVQSLANILNEKHPMTVGRWVRNLMPDFYKNECFSKTRYYKEKASSLII
jgi:5-methylcytosine-specific restriction endonuclease McrA